MTDNTSRIIEVEVTSDEEDISIDESDDIAINQEERHTGSGRSRSVWLNWWRYIQRIGPIF
jgi:hypothetical protein